MKLSHFATVAVFGASLAATSFAQPTQQASARGIRPGSGMGFELGMEAGAGHNNKATRFGGSNNYT